MGSLSLYALRSDKTLWVAGSNAQAQLGDNSMTNRTSPVTVAGNHNFKAVGDGYTFAFGIKDNHETWAWGENTYGQLGNGNKTAYSSPILAVNSYSFVKISGGPRNAGGLTTNGEAYQWGQNGSVYLLGINAAGDRSTPTLVAGNHSFIDMVTTYFNGYGLKDNGQLWAWGGNSFSSYLGVGDGTTTDRTSPVLVAGNHSFIKMAGGGTTCHFAGIKSDGSVWSWGRNDQGQIGDLSKTNKNSPTLVVGNHSFIQISLGILSSMGLKANGEVWTWGYNNLGQLGTNSLTNTSSPVLVVGNHSFIEIKSGYYHCQGLKSNGEVWTWGRNVSGELCDGTFTTRSSPVLIIGGDTYKSFYSITDTPPGTFFSKINIGDSWKSINSINSFYINIGDTWKNVSAMYINVGDVWKSVT